MCTNLFLDVDYLSNLWCKIRKNKAWEKERRDRLNKSFENLAKLIPNYDPSITWTKIEIIQKSIAHIEHLHQRTEKYIATKDPEALKNHKELTEALTCYQIRNQQLSELLKAANITLPPFNLPKTFANNLGICEEIKQFESSNIKNSESKKIKANDENIYKAKIKKKTDDEEFKSDKLNQILKINNNKLSNDLNLSKKISISSSKDENLVCALTNENDILDNSKDTDAAAKTSEVKISESEKIFEINSTVPTTYSTSSIAASSVSNVVEQCTSSTSCTENSLVDVIAKNNPTSLLSTPPSTSSFPNIPIVIKSSLNVIQQPNPVVLSSSVPLPFITLPPGNLPAIIKFENILRPNEKTENIKDFKPDIKLQTGIKTIKILPQPTVKLYYPSADGKIPIPAIKRKTIVKVKKNQKRRKIIDVEKTFPVSKKPKLDEDDKKIVSGRKELENQNQHVENVSDYHIETFCKKDDEHKAIEAINENLEKTEDIIRNDELEKNQNSECDQKIEEENLKEKKSNQEILKNGESIKKSIDDPNSIQLKLPNVNTHIRTVSPTAAFLKSFPKVTLAPKPISDITNDEILSDYVPSENVDSKKDNEVISSSNNKSNEKKDEKYEQSTEDLLNCNKSTLETGEKDNKSSVTEHIIIAEKQDNQVSTGKLESQCSATNVNLADTNDIIPAQTFNKTEKYKMKIDKSVDILADTSFDQNRCSSLILDSIINSKTDTVKSISTARTQISSTSHTLYTANTKPVPIFSPYFDEPILTTSARNPSVSVSSLNLSTQGPICTPLPLENFQKNKNFERVHNFNFSIPAITSNASFSQNKNNSYEIESKPKQNDHRDKAEIKSNISNQTPSTSLSDSALNSSSHTPGNLVSELFPYTPLTLPNMWNTITKPTSNSITNSSYVNYNKPFYLDSLPVFNPNLSTSSLHNNVDSTKSVVTKNSTEYSLSNASKTNLSLNQVSLPDNLFKKVSKTNLDLNAKMDNIFESNNFSSSENVKDLNKFSSSIDSYPAFTFSLSSSTQSKETKSSISNSNKSTLTTTNSIISNSINSIRKPDNTYTVTNTNNTDVVNAQISTLATFSTISSITTSSNEKKESVTNYTTSSFSSLPLKSKSEAAALSQPFSNTLTSSTFACSNNLNKPKTEQNENFSQIFDTNKNNLPVTTKLNTTTTSIISSMTTAENVTKNSLFLNNVNDSKRAGQLTDACLNSVNRIYPSLLSSSVSKISNTSSNGLSLDDSIKAIDINSFPNDKTLQAISTSISSSTETLIKVSNNTTNLEKNKLKSDYNTSITPNLIPNSLSSCLSVPSDCQVNSSENSTEKLAISNNFIKFPCSNIPPWTSNLLQSTASNNYLGYEVSSCSYSGFNYNSTGLTQTSEHYPSTIISEKQKLNVSRNSQTSFVGKTDVKGKDIYSVSNLFDTKPKNLEIAEANFQYKLGNKFTQQTINKNLHNFVNLNNCEIKNTQTHENSISKLSPKTSNNIIESNSSKDTISVSSSSGSLSLQNSFSKSSENTDHIKNSFVGSTNTEAKTTLVNQTSIDSHHNDSMLKIKEKDTSKSKIFNEISGKSNSTNFIGNVPRASSQLNDSNSKTVSLKHNNPKNSVNTSLSHSTNQNSHTISKSDDVNKNLMPTITGNIQKSSNSENFMQQKTKSAKCINSLSFTTQSHNIANSTLYTSISNNLETKPTWSTSNKLQKENVDRIVLNSDNCENNSYSSTNCNFYSNSKNYYYPIQGENSTTYNSYPIAPIISQSNSYNLDQNAHNSCLISYSNIKPDLPWMAPPPPTIPSTPLPTNDYNMFTFSLTPTTNSYVTTTNQYATTNFSFSLTTPKTSTLVTSSNKFKNYSNKTTLLDQTPSLDYNLGLNNMKNQITESANSQFSSQKSSNKGQSNFITNNVEKSNYNFSIDSQLNLKNEISQTNIGSAHEINSINHEFKIPNAIKTKSKITTPYKTEKRPSDVNKDFYDCEISKTCSNVKTAQKSTVNWMTSNSVVTSSASECNSSLYEDFNSQFSSTNVNDNNNFTKKSNCYSSIDENIVTWSSNKVVDHSIHNYNHQHYYGSSTDFQIDNDFWNNNYLPGSSCKQTKIEKQPSKEQNVNNFFSIKQFVDQTSSPISNQNRQKSINDYRNVQNQEQHQQILQQNNQSQLHSQQNHNILRTKNDINNNQKKNTHNKLKDQSYKEVSKTSAQNVVKFEGTHLNQQEHQSDQAFHKTTQSLTCNYSAESLISKKEKTSKVLSTNYNSSFDHANLYNSSCNSVTQNTELTDQQHYNTNYFPSYSSTNNSSSNNNNLTSEIDYLGASVFQTANESNNESYNKFNSVSLLKETKKSNFISNYSSSTPMPHFSHTHHSSYDSNYLSVPSLIPSGVTNENYDSTFSYNNNTTSANNSFGISNGYQYGNWNNISKQHIVGSQNSGNVLNSQYSQQPNLSNSNLNSEQIPINTHSQTSSAGNLPNFNLSSICPEINDKVCPNNNNNVW